MLDRKVIAAVFGFENEAAFSESVATKLEKGSGGEDNSWGADCNVGLNKDQKYLVILRGSQKLDISNMKGMTAERAKGMANNLIIIAIPVSVNAKGNIKPMGTPFTALVGGRALCQAGISDCNSKNRAMQEGTPVLLSFVEEFIPEEKRTQTQKDNGQTTKKIYSASKLTDAQEKDVQGFLPTPAPTEPAPVKGK